MLARPRPNVKARRATGGAAGRITPAPPSTAPAARHPDPSPRAWHGLSLARDHYLLPIPAQVQAELEAALGELRRAAVPTLLRVPEHFALTATARFREEARRRLNEGPGFVMLDRLPVDAMSRDEAIALYWVLMSFLEPPVAQEWKGTVIYDVRHDGREYSEDTRGALTPAGLEMHTDSSMGEAPPSSVSLCCLRPARSGGMSIVSSAAAAHNHFLTEHPALLRRLYDVFYRDHQEYQAADAAATNFRPVFAWDGRLRTRFNARHIVRALSKPGPPHDGVAAPARRLTVGFLGDPAHRLDLWLERGQIQVLNNRVIGHGRTPYEDQDEPELRRHLVRLWLRAGDRRQFRG
jgi:alpha-ketoglutarate-dependent taurine dioxygenase